MSPTAASHSLPEVMLWAGIITGSIDLCAALTFAATRGTKPKLVLQAIASALIWPKSLLKYGCARCDSISFPSSAGLSRAAIGELGGGEFRFPRGFKQSEP